MAAARAHLTTPANTKSFPHHALTTLLATTFLHLFHSSGLGAEGREMRKAESTSCG
jgi:hypothetical protein